MPRGYTRQIAKYGWNCGSPKVGAKERCSSCYKWIKYKNIERPERLWRLDATCENVNCRRPLNRTKRRYKALCRDCSLYWSLTGEYRPRKYCNKHWCDCGEIAIKEIEIMVGSPSSKMSLRKESLWLCENCLEEEKRLNASLHQASTQRIPKDL